MRNTLWQRYTRGILLLPGCLLFLLLCADLTMAQTWYVKPTAEIPLRRGQGSDYKILAIVQDGTAVSIQEEKDPWARVTTNDGKEGWVLKRYLTTEAPLAEVNASLSQENERLKEQVAALRAKNDELSSSTAILQSTLDSNSTELSETTEKYQQLVNDTSDVITIKNNLEQSKQTIMKLQQELGAITAENNRLRASQNIKWFLAGGGTLIFGCIVGLLSSQSRKRKSSLY